MLADIQTNDSVPANELLLCPSEFGPLAIFPMNAIRRRVVATVERARGRGSLTGVGAEDTRANAHRAGSRRRRCTGAAISASITGTFSSCASDASSSPATPAHIHSPFGGQGMNTGLHDAWNLVWKLDLFLRGRGNQRLLDSYSSERIPVIQNVIATTHRLTQVMGTPNKLAQALRDTVIPMVSRLAPFQHAFVAAALGARHRLFRQPDRRGTRQTVLRRFVAWWQGDS